MLNIRAEPHALDKSIGNIDKQTIATTSRPTWSMPDPFEYITHSVADG